MIIEFSHAWKSQKILNRNPISTIALDGIQATLGSFLRTLLQILLVVVFCRPKHTCLFHLNHNLVLVLGLCLFDEVLSDSLPQAKTYLPLSPQPQSCPCTWPVPL